MLRSQGAANSGTASIAGDTVTLAPGAVANVVVSATPVTIASQLTPLETIGGLGGGADRGDTAGKSLAPLFANLGVAARADGLPPQVQQAVAQVLAQRTSLDQNLTGDDIKKAFESSGLFLEASLASGSVPSSSAAPDLKAALIVFRQALTTSLGSAPVTPGTSAALVHRQHRGAGDSVTDGCAKHAANSGTSGAAGDDAGSRGDRAGRPVVGSSIVAARHDYCGAGNADDRVARTCAAARV